MTTMSNDDALRAIHAVLDGEEEWNADTLEEIARIITEMGFVIRDFDPCSQEEDRP